LKYFDEDLADDCGNCDNCRKTFEKFDGTIIAQKALSAVARTGQRMGLSYLVDFLRGSKSQKIWDEHKNLKTYGVGADISKENWFEYFKDLLAQGILRQTEEKFPRIVLTEKSEDVLRGKVTVELFKAAEREEKRTSLVSDVSLPYIKELFDALKKLRSEFSRSEGVPPYVVFSDAALIEMATYLPQTSSEMLKISGVGDVKMDKYGLDFLRAVKEYCRENGLSSRIELKTPKREPKRRTKRNADGDDTYTITLKMFRSGSSVEQIAEERGLSPNTIETHLVRFIPTGEVRLAEIVAEEKIEPIRKAILELNAEQGIAPVKEFLGEDFSYGEIRAVIADFMRIGKAATH
jgi:ATP-dependent DNA helicase RecQ